jgi:glycosyltransferase involved in cell wall biosynthesis
MDSNSANSTSPFKILIFVVCYNAEKSIERVLDRIPEEMWQNTNFTTEVLIIDDQSPDQTFFKANQYSQKYPERKITVLYNPKNLGYGGNQKVGYYYAIKNNFDAVILLHGDGQYAPEYLPKMIRPILDNQADAVLGSRMLHKWNAIAGKMPFYKWIGNQILTSLQNQILHSRLSEFHSGYRAYRVSVLKEIPFQYNADYFDFDTDIIIQLLDTRKKIVEIPVPTFYGDEICRVNGIKYACKILHSCFLSRLNRLGLYYHPKFDYIINSNSIYQSKFGYSSSHQFAFDLMRPDTTVLDLGCGPGYMARALEQKRIKTISLDRQILPETAEHSWKCIEADVETYAFDDPMTKIDTILLLDILEHLKSPERFLRKLRHAFADDCPNIIITTGNVGYLPIRLNLLLGGFHFGKRGILDMDHTRLFTFSSLTRLLENQGYEIFQKKGIPAPFPLAIGNGPMSRVLLVLNQFLIFLCKSLFAYQIAIQAKPLPTLDYLLQQAHQTREKLLEESGS